MKKNFLKICIVLFIGGMAMSCSAGSQKDNNDPEEKVNLAEKEDLLKETPEITDYEKDSELTDEYFVERYSIYNNPIDKYYWSKINSWEPSVQQVRKAQEEYKKAWKTEYKNMIKWLRNKCVYDEDKKNIDELEENIAKQVKIEKGVMLTELLNVYEVNPDPRKVENTVSRYSYGGTGTRGRIDQGIGEIYRDVCMRITHLYGGEEDYEFVFQE